MISHLVRREDVPEWGHSVTLVYCLVLTLEVAKDSNGVMHDGRFLVGASWSMKIERGRKL